MSPTASGCRCVPSRRARTFRDVPGAPLRATYLLYTRKKSRRSSRAFSRTNRTNAKFTRRHRANFLFVLRVGYSLAGPHSNSSQDLIQQVAHVPTQKIFSRHSETQETRPFYLVFLFSLTAGTYALSSSPSTSLTILSISLLCFSHCSWDIFSSLTNMLFSGFR